MSDKPAIVLVHGFWGGAAHWAKVILELKRRGYDRVFAVENPLTALADDAERTRKMLAQVDGPVVLVGLGGMTSAPTQAWWRQATLAAPLETAVMATKPWLPDDLAKRIRFS